MRYQQNFRYIAILAMLIACGLTLAKCKTSAAGDTMIVTASDNGKEIALKRNEALKVRLKGNPTTGFDWHVVKNDTAVLKQKGEPAYEADRDIPGSPGMVTMTFESGKKGISHLSLAYFRAWEHDVAPIDSFSITVRVK